MRLLHKNGIIIFGFLTIALLASVGHVTLQKDGHMPQMAYAQQPNQTASNEQPELFVQIPQWIRDDTALWSHGKLTDSQFSLVIRYLVANGMLPLPQSYISSNLQSPIPPWIKDVAQWWTDGNISDYEFISDLQYLVDNGEIMLVHTTSETTEQDSNLLTDNFPKGVIKLDNVTLDVQIANTTDRMTEGLQFQQQLPYNQGMIFIFGQPQIVSMWMTDMQFPLDMIWFDSNGNVVHIEKDLAPCTSNASCPTYNGAGQTTKYVLEVTAGFVDKFNITNSSKMTILQD